MVNMSLRVIAPNSVESSWIVDLRLATFLHPANDFNRSRMTFSSSFNPNRRSPRPIVLRPLFRGKFRAALCNDT
jgi:hypothetical protein